MIDPVTIGLGLKIADAVGLTGWIGDKLGGDAGRKTAEAITGVASTITGEQDPQAILDKLKHDAELSSKLKQAIMDNEQELKLAYLEDIQSARTMYQNTDHQMADMIAKRVIDWNIWVVAILVSANVGCMIYIKDATIAVAVGNIIGGSISYLWNERQKVLEFFFGSSLGSKDKTKQLMGKG